MSDKQLWVVACQDFHVAIGPYEDVVEATGVARDLTDQSACVFLPIPLVLADDEAKAQVKGYEETQGRGYL